MIYVMSDLHGEFEKYQDGLKAIEFSDDDSLFVLGNVMDYGDHAMDILLDMMYRVNVYGIRGKHDGKAQVYLSALLEGVNGTGMADFEAACPGVVDWITKMGGQSTVEDFMKLEKTQKEQVVEFLEEFELYDEVTVNDTDYVFVSGGIDGFDPEKEMDEYDVDDFFVEEMDYSRVYFEDKILVSGGKLTSKIEGHSGKKIFKKNQHIAMNCGCSHGGTLAILCLDTGEEFYIK